MCSSRFDQAVEWTLVHEGGFSDHPNDPGGATNYGISIRLLHQLEQEGHLRFDLDGDGDVDADDIRLLTKDAAKALYRQHFWYEELDRLLAPANSTKLFDMGVNMGLRQAGRLFQQCLKQYSPHLVVDGWIGPETLRAERLVVDNAQLQNQLTNLCATQAKFYYGLVERRRSREVFLFGWLRRAYALPD